MINVTINGKTVCVEEGTTILQAARKIDIQIPTLCYNPDLPAWASCGICIVRMEGTAKMIRACCTAVTEGMSIITHDPEIVRARRTVLELILSNHPDDCLSCSRNNRCELQSLAANFGLRTIRFDKILKDQPTDDSNDDIVLNRNKCINCGRCVEACQLMQNVWALEYTGRGNKTIIGPVGGVDLNNSPCIRCGQCAVHCPTEAITTNHSNSRVWEKICDPQIVTAVQIAPSVRVAIGEEFGFEPGEISSRKIYTALRRIGFDYVFDTNFGADLTIMEEASEFVSRIGAGGPFPMFTSCCPGWVNYAEKNYHDLLPNLSTAKSPQQMQGAITKTYWAEQLGLDPAKVCSVSVMPCSAKNHEAHRDETMKSSGYSDVDISITTRDFARMIRQAGINFRDLEESDADNPLGQYSGAGTIFGATGGVMEAAVRSAYFFATGNELDDVNLTPVRGLADVKSFEVDVAGKKLRLGVIHQLSNVDKVVQEVRDAIAAGQEPPYHFIEVMACRGGCVSGGGQPYGSNDAVRAKRAAGLYRDDENCEVRVSHKNPQIVKLYDTYLKKPGGERAHHLLHTHYTKRKLYNYEVDE